MKKLNFLVIGKNEQILCVLKRVIQYNKNWNAIITNNEIDLYRIISNNKIDIVLLSCGLEKDVENKINNYVTKNNPGTKVIEHYGGGSGLLLNEVLTEFPNLNCNDYV
jgi:hypothetical protein